MISQPKVSFNQLKKLSAKKRIDLLSSASETGGGSLLGNLTPTQIAELFPNYLKKYADQVDIRGFRQALTREGQRQVQSGDNIEVAMKQAAAENKTVYQKIKEAAAGTVERVKRKGQEIREDISEFVTGGSKVPGLNKEAGDAFKKVKQGPIAVDSGEGKVLSRLSRTDLETIGVTKTTDKDGKETYTYTAPKVSKEEVAAKVSKNVEAGVGNLQGGAALQKRVYDAYRNAGFSDMQARALTAEVGRENSYRPEVVFGVHPDPQPPHRKNLGMISMQKDRGVGLFNYLNEKGLIDKNGHIVPGQESLNAMAAYQKKEMTEGFSGQSKKEREMIKQFLNSPDVDRQTAADLLGRGYIKWRIDDPKYRSDGLKNLSEYRDRLDKNLGGFKQESIDVSKMSKEEYDKISEKIKTEKESYQQAFLARKMFAYEKEHGLPHSDASSTGTPGSTSGTSKWSDIKLYNQAHPNDPGYKNSPSKTGLCAKGSMYLMDQLFPNSKYFQKHGYAGHGNAADHINNGYLQGSGMYGSPRKMTEEEIKLAKENKLPLGTGVVMGGGKPLSTGGYAGHIQFQGPGYFLSDHKQKRFYAPGEGGGGAGRIPWSEAYIIPLTKEGSSELEKSGWVQPGTTKTVPDAPASTTNASYEKKDIEETPAPIEPTVEQQTIEKSESAAAQTAPTIPTDPSQGTPQGTHWVQQGDKQFLFDDKTGAMVSQLKGTKRYDEILGSVKPQEQTTGAPTTAAEKNQAQKEQPKVEPEKPKGPVSGTFNINKDSFIAKVRELDARAYLADSETIRNGFNDDPRVKAAGVNIDENWKLHGRDINNPDFKDAVKDFGSGILTPVKEKKAEADTAATKTATLGEKLQREFGVASAQAAEGVVGGKDAFQREEEYRKTHPYGPEMPKEKGSVVPDFSKETGVGVRPLAAAPGLKPNSNLIHHESQKTVPALGVDQSQYNAFREAIAGIESSGGKYNLRGGSSKRFSGAYQMGANEIKTAAKMLGEEAPVMKMGRKTVADENFLNDPAMQERYFDALVFSNHQSLMRRNKIYANLSPLEQLKILGYAHNQGAGGASKWLRTGQSKKDAFGTDASKYPKAIDSQLAELQRQNQAAAATQMAEAKPVEQQNTIQPTPTEKPFYQKTAEALGISTPKAAAETVAPAKPVERTTKPTEISGKPSASVSAPAPKQEAPAPKQEAPTPAPKQEAPAPQAGKPDESSTKSFLKSQGIPGAATGGTFDVSNVVDSGGDMLQAFPMQKDGNTGDNLMVANKNQQPMFTMNTNESATYDPASKTIDIQPRPKKAQGPMQPPGNIMDTMHHELMSIRNDLQQAFATSGKASGDKPAPELEKMPQEGLGLVSSLVNANQMVGNPSFIRAMTRTRFQETGGGMDDNHYSNGNAR